MKKICKLLIANRSKISIRMMRAATELDIRTIGSYSNEYCFALHRVKADEIYLAGTGKKPIQAYMDIGDIIRIAKEDRGDAIHRGYDPLAGNPDFSPACAENGIAFVGPEVMRWLGNKVAARCYPSWQ